VCTFRVANMEKSYSCAIHERLYIPLCGIFGEGFLSDNYYVGSTQGPRKMRLSNINQKMIFTDQIVLSYPNIEQLFTIVETTKSNPGLPSPSTAKKCLNCDKSLQSSLFTICLALISCV
jgi:hypothetical protein